MTEFNLSSTRLNEIQNHDDFQVVWFCSDNNVPNELTNFVDYLKKCHSFETCDNYIKGFQSERKILLVLIYLFDHTSYFNDLSQIQSINVLERNTRNVKYEKQKYSKLIDIFTDEHTLIERLRQDILLTYRNDLPISISRLDEINSERSLTSLDKNTLMFLWNQFFTDYLINFPHTDMNQLKNDMVEQCQLEYKNNQVQLTNIDYFVNNCTNDNALNWYTKDSFLYRLLNKAFRTQNIHLICKFQYFTILLYKQLKELSIKQQQENYMKLFRGQILSRNDLEKLESNVGHLISVNTIMSTTRKEDVARAFIIGAKAGVIFQINVESTKKNILHPFADISHFSSNPDEEEILFFSGTVFHIDSVEKESDSTWIVKLTLKNETIEQIKQIMDGLAKQLSNTTYLHHLF
ncbi:unnamed protein product, partial [Didymodactylos carnosus]